MLRASCTKIAARQLLRIYRVPQRTLFLSARTLQAKSLKVEKTSDDQEASTTTPWYMNVVEKPTDDSIFQKQDIKLPSNAPNSLVEITNFLRDDLGLTDILVFDLRSEKDSYSTAATKISDFMVLGTATSTKHCQKGFVELNSLLKREFKVVGQVEGNVSSNELRKQQRRLARHTNLSKSLGSNTTTTRSSALMESWYMIDCHVDGIFVNILTDKRRRDMNLEELYAPEAERHLFRREENLKQSLEDEEEDNVLAGLKRLAARNQRRFYSTANSDRDLFEALQQQDFIRANNLIANTDSPPLRILKTLTGALASMDSKTEIHFNKWKNSFDKAWPLFFTDNGEEYWSTRLHFIKLINCACPHLYGIDKILTDYLELKLALGGRLTKSDIVEFLQMVVITLNEKPNGDYWDLTKKNKYVVRALALFQSVEPQIVMDEEVMPLILRTMAFLNRDSTDSLHALYEIIDFICVEYKEQIPLSVVNTVMQILAHKKDWPKFLSFWEKGIQLPNRQDYRPWNIFLDSITSSGDKALMLKIINEGHLLWLKRNNVIITPEIQNSVNEFFAAVDPTGITFKELKDYLLA
ncbi:LAFE_0H15764g1_1 [Lachancea fermentati]|uniref:ATPase synthesis protein 25 n=1 Tax=Lachancea fermentati TaxID=4955 RepID=A0A1G4MKW9_LACFM|nr:LAFE_0H15764g1_1 [Lachancea fermentati]